MMIINNNNVNLLAKAFIILHIRDWSLLNAALEDRLRLCGFQIGRDDMLFPHLTNRCNDLTFKMVCSLQSEGPRCQIYESQDIK